MLTRFYIGNPSSGTTIYSNNQIFDVEILPSGNLLVASAYEVNEITPADITTMPPVDPVTHAGLSPAAAARAMTVPKGFTVTLAAAEPDVVRPIAFAYDDRGRLWVAEGHTYPVRAPEGQGRDRILIFEDTNGDGRLDRRKIFMENLNLLSAIEVGFGGVWVGAAPYLMFIPVAEGEDRPARHPEARDPERHSRGTDEARRGPAHVLDPHVRRHRAP